MNFVDSYGHLKPIKFRFQGNAEFESLNTVSLSSDGHHCCPYFQKYCLTISPQIGSFLDGLMNCGSTPMGFIQYLSEEKFIKMEGDFYPFDPEKDHVVKIWKTEEDMKTEVVPSPGALVLFVSTLAGLALVKRRQQV